LFGDEKENVMEEINKMVKKQEVIDLNKLSFGELTKVLEQKKKDVVEIKNKKPKGMTYCIIRTYSAGVFAGLINRNIKGKETTIYDSRRLWYWDGANSLSQLANDGTKKPIDCKFAQIVKETDLKEVIEVIPCSVIAEKSIKGVKVWEQ